MKNVITYSKFLAVLLVLNIFVFNLKAGTACFCDNDGDGKADSTYGTTGYNASKSISAHFSFDGKTLTVTSKKYDLSNIVISYSDGSTQKYEPLKGTTKTVTATKAIYGVWVKAGSNGTSDCAGCGEWIANPAPYGCGCTRSTYDQDGDGKVDSLYGAKAKDDDNTIFASFAASAKAVTITTTRFALSKVTLLYTDKTTGTYSELSGNSTTLNTSKAISGVYVTSGSTTNNYIPDPIISSVTALPVTLVGFTAMVENGSVKLNWTTATEINNSHFEVERSTDGRSFDKIGEVAGHGNSSMLIRYSYTDEQAAQGNVYYRLRQVDFNGDYEYSPIVAVRGTEAAAPSLEMNLYPNPVMSGSQANIDITATEEGSASIVVFNLSGQVAYEAVQPLQKGHNVLLLPLESAPAGMYMVRAVVNGQALSQKLQINP